MVMNSTTQNDKPSSHSQQTDSIPRITVRDLFSALLGFEKKANRTLEDLRRQFCADRGKYRGDFLWSAARDNAVELQRLGLIEGGPFPKDSRAYQTLRDSPLVITSQGKELIRIFRTDRALGYDSLFKAMHVSHPYLRMFVRLIMERPVFVPVITSLKEHVASQYGSANTLANDVSKGIFDTPSLLSTLERRTGRPLTEIERHEIDRGLKELVHNTQMSACADEPREFAKKFILKLNEVVIPALFRGDTLDFDYRTHRVLWTLGEAFRLWAAVRSHPQFDGWVIFRTALVQSTNGTDIDELVFDSGLQRTEDHFLEKLYAAYEKTQALAGKSHVLAWELRSVFCYENRCQVSVFNRLFDAYRNGDRQFEVHMELQGQKPKHEQALRAGDRNVGSIRVVKRQTP
jgi:hypothetical protein